MLTIYSDQSGVTRRELLRIGTAGVGGLSLSNLLAMQAHGARTPSAFRDKSVVVLNLQHMVMLLVEHKEVSIVHRL